MVTCQFAIYVLKTDAEDQAVERALAALRGLGVTPEAGTMSTLMQGDETLVFNALRAAFTAAAALGPTVLTATVSNACPVEPAGPWADPSPA